MAHNAVGSTSPYRGPPAASRLEGLEILLIIGRAFSQNAEASGQSLLSELRLDRMILI